MRIASSVALAALCLSACGPSADADRPKPTAERLFSQCAVCHTAAPPDTPAGKVRLVGPPLWGVYGEPAAGVETFTYSRAMKSAGLVWDDATLDAFLKDPQGLVPGTLMSFAGEADEAKRAAIIGYLKTLM